MSAAKPMNAAERYSRYTRQNGGMFRLTPRQCRRIIHKANRAVRKERTR